MKSSPFLWDAIVVTKDGRELLLSKLGPSVLCNICLVDIKTKEFMQHNVDKHGWKVIVGTIK